MSMSKKAECPACFYEWEHEDDDVVAGEVITCPDCGLDLEIVEITDTGLKLETLEASDEDWGE